MTNNQSPQLDIETMLACYQNGQYETAQNLALSITKQFPNHNISWKVLSEIHIKSGKMDSALIAIQKAVKINPKDAEAHNNMGLIYFKLKLFEKAIKSSKKAIELKPDFVNAHNNLGIILQKIEKFEQAEFRFKKAIELNSDYAEAHYNLGTSSQRLGKLDKAEESYKKVIELKANFVEAHYNLGIIFQRLGKLIEAEACYKKVIELKPNFVEAHYNLGIISQRLGKLIEAEACYKKVIELKPNFEVTYNNLGNTVKELGKLVEAEMYYKKAIELNSDNTMAKQNLDILLREKKLSKFLQTGKLKNIKESNILSPYTRLSSTPLIANREVEVELISSLYKINSTKLGNIKGSPLFGIGKSSTNYQLFENDLSILNNVKKDLINIMEQAIKSDIYIMESFFNILGEGSGSVPHTHIGVFDKVKGLIKKKFSLVYYLSVGDQNCTNPGAFKLHDIDKEILPSNGMIIIIPADQKHSAVYNGKLDRVMIGVNFYSLI